MLRYNFGTFWLIFKLKGVRPLYSSGFPHY